jgi:23S rRNA pseudouridine1911/1915/1917 synthase
MDAGPIIVQVRAPVRLDVFLTRRLAHVSRNRIQRHILAGDVLVDGRRVRPSHLLTGGETLTLPPLEARRHDVAAEAVPLRVVYEDADLVVVDKPSGLVMHPVGGEFRRTVLGALHRRLVAAGEDPTELGPVHRLDRLTSGLVVVAKRSQARRVLGAAVEARRVRRAYVAVVDGAPPATRGRIDLHIRRDPARPTRMQALDAAGLAAARRAGWKSPVSASGYSDPRLDLRPRAAHTRWAVLRRLAGATLLRCELDTGRTHQIRVHLQGIGCPILGDPLYGPPDDQAGLERPALHAARLEFQHPQSGQRLRFLAPLPEELRDLVRRLGAPPA